MIERGERKRTADDGSKAGEGSPGKAGGFSFGAAQSGLSMSHQTKRPFDSVECSTPHDLLIRCSLSNLQFPAIALTWCGLTSHRHRSIEPFFMSLAARDSEFRRLRGPSDRRICQTFAASPAEPGELPLGFSAFFISLLRIGIAGSQDESGNED